MAAFSLQSVTKHLFSKSGGILGTLHLLRKVLIIFQYFLESVEGSASSSPWLLRYFSLASRINSFISDLLFSTLTLSASKKPFCLNFLYILLCFRRRVLILFVNQGGSDGRNVFSSFGTKFATIFKIVLLSRRTWRFGFIIFLSW